MASGRLLEPLRIEQAVSVHDPNDSDPVRVQNPVEDSVAEDSELAIAVLLHFRDHLADSGMLSEPLGLSDNKLNNAPSLKGGILLNKGTNLLHLLDGLDGPDHFSHFASWLSTSS